MKRSIYQAAVALILLYGCTTWTLTKRLEKKLDGNYTRILRAILNSSWQQHPTRHQLYGHLPPITKTIQVRRTRHAGHCWRSRDELISDVLLWTPTHGRARRPAWTYIQQLCEDTGCCPEDLPEAMNDREKWPERVRDIRATSTTWWWWWWYMYHKIIYIYIYYIYIYIYILQLYCPISWGCRIHWLYFCRGVRPPPMSVQDMTLNDLMVRLQWYWSFGECGATLHCYCSLVHCSPGWCHLMGPYLWVK